MRTAGALPASPTDGASAFRVFLGDSLQTVTRGELLFGHTEDAMRLTTPSGNQALIPMDLVQSPSFAENMRRMVNAAVGQKPLPPGIANKGNLSAVEACHRDLTRIIEAEGNSVWTWYAVNLAGPHLLAQRKIDRIVANPPWVKLSDIQVVERKRSMESFGKGLGLQAGGKLAPHLDIASFFILRTRELYAADPDGNPGCWLVKKSAIGAGQWEAFRKLHSKALAQTVDLEQLNPFNGGDATRCCLLMEHRTMRDTPDAKVEAVRTVRRRLSVHEPLSSARGIFEFTAVPDALPQEPSRYITADIRQGATILPHVLALVWTEQTTSRFGWSGVETAISRHRPWSGVHSQRGMVPTAWVRPMHRSRDLLPYMVGENPSSAIIPVGPDGELNRDPGRECSFWSELDEIYDAHRGRGKGTPETLIEQFDFAAKLSVQPLRGQRGRRMVLYPASADIMRAARTNAGVAVVNETLYWMVAQSEAEAGYLVALLNATCLRRAFAECKESGRDFHLHPWRKVPIPQYDRHDEAHRRLAALCSAAEKIVLRRVTEELQASPDLGQPGLSKAAREALQETRQGREIERIAAQLLPEQAD